MSSEKQVCFQIHENEFFDKFIKPGKITLAWEEGEFNYLGPSVTFVSASKLIFLCLTLNLEVQSKVKGYYIKKEQNKEKVTFSVKIYH